MAASGEKVKFKATIHSECVRVVIRCRPMLPKEISQNRECCVEMSPEKGEICMRRPHINEPPKMFTFDSVYDQASIQEEIYLETSFPIVENVLEGYNGTIFAYGQTGTGKTHTIAGLDLPGEEGILPRAFDTVFNHIKIQQQKRQYLVRASYLEIYKEEIRDLLSSKGNFEHKLELHEKKDAGVYVKDLSTTVVSDAKGLAHVLKIGNGNRTTAATEMNDRSSRSHAIFTITIETSQMGQDGKEHYKVGKLNMVDLAGSEKQSKTHAVGDRLDEAIKINLSLTTLCHVISTLVDRNAQHIPYRNSKLTRLLQDSLGGNTKTVMVANIGPADYNYEESVNTLRYANRAKHIQNKPRINEDPKDAMLREMQDEISRLKAQLEAQGGSMERGSSPSRGGMKIIQKEKIIYVEDKEKIEELQSKIEQEKEDMRIKVEEDIAKVTEAKELAEEEKKNLIDNLNKKNVLKRKTKEKQQQLLKKMNEYKDKIVIGEKMIEQAKKQEFSLQKARAELDIKKREEIRLAQNLKQRKEAHDLLGDRYSTQQEELEAKNHKLKQLWTHFQSAKIEIRDLQDEFYREREEMMDNISDLIMRIQLRNLIIENFIPGDVAVKVQKKAHWSDEVDDWIIPASEFKPGKAFAQMPKSAMGLKRPLSEYTRIARGLGDANPRYKYDNIINLDLDMPEMMSENFDGNLSMRVQNAINNTLNEQDDEMAYLAIDATPGINMAFESEEKEKEIKPKRPVKPRTAKRPQTAAQRRGAGIEEITFNESGAPPPIPVKPELFPKAKGLVSSKVITD